jgi:uncharacterized protein
MGQQMSNTKVTEGVWVNNDDADLNNSNNPSFESVLNARLSRRKLLGGAMGTAGMAVLSSWGVAGCSSSDDGGDSTPAPSVPSQPNITALNFTAVGKSLADRVVVPAGYTATVLYRLGDPLRGATSNFRNDGTDTDYDWRAGDHHDGIEYFGLNAAGARDDMGSTRGILGMNHEALTTSFLFPAGPTNPTARPAAEADKEIAAHGVSLIEVQRPTGGTFNYVQLSSFNRRITAATPIELAGPVRGNALARTRFSTAGTSTRGTVNNCGTGKTPWGTLLTGEENWAGYFARAAGDNAVRGATSKSVVSLTRYGVAQGSNGRHAWATAGADDRFARWNASKTGTAADGVDDYSNVANTFGYIVEIDPYNPAAPIKKRTTSGRMAHESAAFATPAVGKPLAVYYGDDSRNEYIFKFVSRATWVAADANASDRMAIGDKYLDDGVLYVAKYNADGSGEWIALTMANPTITAYATYRFADQADIFVNARLAGDAVGATRMDRPEWCTVNPKNNEIYFTLTNNSQRTAATADAANPRVYTDQRGVTPAGGAATTNNGNVNGHIIRMREEGGEPNATRFRWDVYAFGAEATGAATTQNLSGLTADNDFSSPDGLWFSPYSRLLWIQTDDGAYTDVTNCMMLAAIPGNLGDGTTATLSYTVDGAPKNVTTYVGARPTATTLKRFLVGPVDSEITGVTETPDGRAMFVNIQHPGEDTSLANLAAGRFTSNWPDGGTARPRSATIVITKTDGGIIGT